MTKRTEYLVFTDKVKHKKYVVGKGSTLKLVFFASSALSCTFDLDVTLTGKDSTAEVVGLVMPQPSAHLTIRTRQDHRGFSTKSTLLVKSVIPDRSAVTFTGIVRIEKNARLSDAYQKNETMLLGDTSRIHTSPILEILNHDVKCTHGATAKPVAGDELWYLQSRGIPKSQARGMIVRGFIDDVVSQFPDSNLRKNMYNDIHLV